MIHRYRHKEFDHFKNFLFLVIQHNRPFNLNVVWLFLIRVNFCAASLILPDYQTIYLCSPHRIQHRNEFHDNKLSVLIGDARNSCKLFLSLETLLLNKLSGHSRQRPQNSRENVYFFVYFSYLISLFK